MRSKFLYLCFLSLLVVLSFRLQYAHALTIDTHADLNKSIIQIGSSDFLLDNYLKNNLVIANGVKESFNGKLVEDWFYWSGKYEDEPNNGPKYSRSVNHFHDPLKPWLWAGYNSLWLASPNWAVSTHQYYGDYSYRNARDYFYNALTATDQTTRDNNYADCFRALGQVMHLVEDSSVPAHTRNDAHVLFCMRIG